MTRHAAPEARREQILEAALRSFSSKGLGATTMDDVARACGLSKGALYYHFRSKREIVLALADTYEEAIFAEGAGAAASLPALERIRQAGAFTLAKLTESRALVEVWADFVRDRSARRRLARIYRRSRALLGDAVRRGIAEGEIRECEPEHVAAAVTGLLEGLLLQALVEAGYDPNAAWPTAWDALARGLSASPDRPRSSSRSR